MEPQQEVHRLCVVGRKNTPPGWDPPQSRGRHTVAPLKATDGIQDSRLPQPQFLTLTPISIGIL